MNEQMIFEMAVNASKAKAFDYIAQENAKVNEENIKLKKIIDTHLENCEECKGTGIKEKTTYMGDDTPCTCIFCEGTGKVPKLSLKSI